MYLRCSSAQERVWVRTRARNPLGRRGLWAISSLVVVEDGKASSSSSALTSPRKPHLQLPCYFGIDHLDVHGHLRQVGVQGASQGLQKVRQRMDEVLQILCNNPVSEYSRYARSEVSKTTTEYEWETTGLSAAPNLTNSSFE